MKAVLFILLSSITNLHAADLVPQLAESEPVNPVAAPPPGDSQAEIVGLPAALDPMAPALVHPAMPPEIRFHILPTNLGKPSPENLETEVNPANIDAVQFGDYHLTLGAGLWPSCSLSLHAGEDEKTTLGQDIPQDSAKAGIFGIKAVSGSHIGPEIAHHRHRPKKHALDPIAARGDTPLLTKVGRSIKLALIKAGAIILPHPAKGQ